jgi:hypothetical protein
VAHPTTDLDVHKEEHNQQRLGRSNRQRNDHTEEARNLHDPLKPPSSYGQKHQHHQSGKDAVVGSHTNMAMGMTIVVRRIVVTV